MSIDIKLIKNQQPEKTLQIISNVLLINTQWNNKIGLTKGKMGIAIFFYLYSRYSANLFDKRFADSIIDSIIDSINEKTNPNSMDGLPGIGWGINYLIKQKYLEKNSIEILTDIDDIIFSEKQKLLSMSDEFFAKGLYITTRINSGCIKTKFDSYIKEVITELCNDNYLIYNNIYSLSNVNSLLYFLCEISKINIVEVKSYVAHIYDNILCLFFKHQFKYDIVDVILFCDILSKHFNSKELQPIRDLIYSERDILSPEELCKHTWNRILYPQTYSSAQIDYLSMLPYKRGGFIISDLHSFGLALLME